MTGGYTILDLGGNLFTVAATDEKDGVIVEGIYDRIAESNPKKPFLLENYSFLEGTEEKAKFLDFSEVGVSFEAELYLNWTGSDGRVNLCFVRVEPDDMVKFFRTHKSA